MKVLSFPIQKLLIAIVLVVRGTFGVLSKVPSNSAVVVGASTTFTCASDVDRVSWIKTWDGRHTQQPREELTDPQCNVYSQYADHFRTDGAGTYSCNLTLFNALRSHGGYYTCVQSAYPSSFYGHSVLIVIDNEAVTQSNKSEEIIDGEVLYMGNTISYGGPWPHPNGQLVLPPTFKWTLQSNLSNTLPSSNAATWNVSSSYYTITAQQTTVPAYVCTLFFNDISVPSFCATNLPNYTRSWTSLQKSVYYMNLPSIEETEYIEPSGGCETRILGCIPDAYPPPIVHWTDMKTMEVFDSENITAELNGTYKCTTRNTIRGEQRNESTTYTVTFNSSAREPCKFVSNDALEILLPDGSSCESESCSLPSCSALTLRCRVTANPPAHYKWLNGGGGEVEGDTVTADKDGTYTCHAHNAVNDRTSNATKSVVVSRQYATTPDNNNNNNNDNNDNNNDDDNTVVIILGVLLGVSVLTNVGLIFWIVSTHKQRKLIINQKSKNRNSTEGEYHQTTRRTTSYSMPSTHEELQRSPKQPVYANTGNGQSIS